MAVFDEDEYPLLAWAADRDVVPAAHCIVCWGSGADGDQPCPCLVRACLETFTAAAGDAQPQPDCDRCDGDGEDPETGALCACLLPDLRSRQEQLELELDDAAEDD